MASDLANKLQQVLRGLEKYDAEKAILFGSCARGDADAYSDIDLIVIKRTDKRFLDRLADIITLIEPDFALDVLVYTPEEFERMLAEDNPLLTNAVEHGKVIYERGQAVAPARESVGSADEPDFTSETDYTDGWFQSKEPLFQSGKDWLCNACLHFARDDWHLYAQGYKQAADVLVAHVIERARGQDLLVYPIAFLYRQCVELQLKMITRDTSSLLGRPDSIEHTHSIARLWAGCRELLKELWPDGSAVELDEAEARVEEFNKADPHSMAFRYPVDKENRPFLSDIAHINIRHLGEVMSGLAEFLDAVCTAIDVELDSRAEFRCDYPL
jgi:predicted nucleotidyltransferase